MTATYTTVPNTGKVQLVVTSNAKKVQVKYRTAKNKKRALNRKLKRGTVTITLPVGAKTITVRAKATSKLATSPWTPATPPPPAVAAPVVTPPIVSPPVQDPPVTPPSDSTPPGPVTGLRATAVTPTSITLSWTNPTDTDLAKVIVNRDGGQIVYEGLAGTFTDTGLTPDTDYTYLVYAQDKAGNQPAASSWTTIQPTTTSPSITRPSMARVGVASDGTLANHGSRRPSISADGRVVAFRSYATNLVPGDTARDWEDLFVHDLESGATSKVARNAWRQDLSADGRYVAFIALWDDAVGDTNNRPDVYVYDRHAGLTSVASVATGGTQANDSSDYSETSISGDGRYVAFTSAASNLVTGDTNTIWDVFVRDRQAGVTSRVSVATGGTQANGMSYVQSISADGRYVFFTSSASNLVTGDTNNAPDMFVHDRQTGETSRTESGKRSDDGRYVAFTSSASDLIEGDLNNAADIFVRDLAQGTTTLVSVATGGTQANAESVGSVDLG